MPYSQALRYVAVMDARTRPLPRDLEQPLGREALLQLLEPHVQFADAERRQRLHDELVLAVRRIDLDAPRGDDVLAVVGAEAQALGRTPPHRARELGLRVLQREVEVARALPAQVRDLPAHRDARKRVAAQRRADPRELAHADRPRWRRHAAGDRPTVLLRAPHGALTSRLTSRSP